MSFGFCQTVCRLSKSSPLYKHCPLTTAPLTLSLLKMTFSFQKKTLWALWAILVIRLYTVGSLFDERKMNHLFFNVISLQVWSDVELLVSESHRSSKLLFAGWQSGWYPDGQVGRPSWPGENRCICQHSWCSLIVKRYSFLAAGENLQIIQTLLTSLMPTYEQLP